MSRIYRAMLLASLAAPIAACGQSGTPAATETTSTTTTTGTVERETVAPEQPPVQPMAAASVIQSQPGPDGSQIDLLKVAVTGDILTVTARCSSGDAVNTENFRIPDISVIDDATAQRISVLKDNAGNWLASRPSGDNMAASCEIKPGVIWAKFPAPPATTKTVSINLPGAAPFDGVPVTR